MDSFVLVDHMRRAFRLEIHPIQAQSSISSNGVLSIHSQRCIFELSDMNQIIEVNIYKSKMRVGTQKMKRKKMNNSKYLHNHELLRNICEETNYQTELDK